MPKKSSKKIQKKKYLFYFLFVFLGFLIALFIINQFADLNPRWSAPEVLKSENGELSLTLNTKKHKVRIGDQEMESNVYNGNHIGQTWEIKGGDKVKVKLENNTSQPTNLHFHGSHVSPKGNSDNVLLNIKPGEDFNYEYNLPKNHPPGL